MSQRVKKTTRAPALFPRTAKARVRFSPRDNLLSSATMPKRRPPPRKNRRAAGCSLRGFVLFALVVSSAWALWTWVTFPDPSTLKDSTPPTSALMRARVDEARAERRTYSVHHAFVPLGRISRVMQRAVVLSEDQRFWEHEGIDWIETRKIIDQALENRKLGRGGSTLTQQLVKNLYLSNDRSLVRKAKEWVLATQLERQVPKTRILELYLNFAEWGDGIFGIEMAARTYFNKSAAQLDAAEAAILTAMLPSPLKRDPRKRSPALAQRSRIIGQMLVDERWMDGATMKARLSQMR